MHLRSPFLARLALTFSLWATIAPAQVTIFQNTSYSSGVVAASSNLINPWAAAQLNYAPAGYSYGVGSVFSVSSNFFLDRIEAPFYAADASAITGDLMQITVAEIASLSATTVSQVLYRQMGAFPVSLTAFDGNFGTIMSFDLSDSAAGLQLQAGHSYVWFANWATPENRVQTVFGTTPAGSFAYATDSLIDMSYEPTTFQQFGSGIRFSMIEGTYVAPVPEPAAYAALLGAGACLGVGFKRRRRSPVIAPQP